MPTTTVVDDTSLLMASKQATLTLGIAIKDQASFIVVGLRVWELWVFVYITSKQSHEIDFSMQN